MYTSHLHYRMFKSPTTYWLLASEYHVQQLIQFYIIFYCSICTRDAFTTAHSGLLLLSSCWLLNTMLNSPLQLYTIFYCSICRPTRIAFTTASSGLLLFTSYWLLNTMFNSPHQVYIIFYCSICTRVAITTTRPGLLLLTVLAIGCPNQLFHCTVRFTHESPLLPHVHISYYLGLMYWLLV